MKDALGGLFKVAGYATLTIFMLWGGWIQLVIVYAWGGMPWVYAGIFLAPIVFIVGPWYLGFGAGNWHPLIVIYGGWFLGSVLLAVGNALSEE